VPLQGVDPAQAITDPAQALQRRLRRALGPGQPLLERHLDPAQDIEPGQRVTVMLDVGAISIRQDGTALTGGRAGDRLRLQMAATRDPVEAVILGPGLARVTR
jgi:flagella basal body P-ring formation protein FlgA